MPASDQIPVAGSTVHTMLMKAAPIPDGGGAWSLRNYERGLSSFGPAHDHVDLAAAALRADELLAPFEDTGISAIAPRVLGGIGLDLMLTTPAPHDQPDAGRSRIAQGHRRTRLRFHLARRRFLASTAARGRSPAWVRSRSCVSGPAAADHLWGAAIAGCATDCHIRGWRSTERPCRNPREQRHRKRLPRTFQGHRYPICYRTR
jgi:hypothetical protein